MNNCNPATLILSCPPPSCGRQHYKKASNGNKRRCSSTAARKKYLCTEMNGNGADKCCNTASKKKNGKYNGSGNGSNGSGDKKKNFMEDVWKVMTPDMLDKLIDILVTDFNMTRADACNFIQQQRDSAKSAQKAASGKCPCADDMVPALPSIEVRNSIIKEFIEVITCKLSDYMALMLCSRKSKRQQVLSETMANSLKEMVGEGPLTKYTNFLADKLASWMDTLFDDQVCKPDPQQDKGGAEKSADTGGQTNAAKAPPAKEPPPQAPPPQAPPPEAPPPEAPPAEEPPEEE